MSHPRTTLVIAAGGTGGHIYPALAIAEHLALTNPPPNLRVVALHSRRPVDHRVIAAARIRNAPIESHALPALPMAANPIRAAKALWACARSVAIAASLLRSWRREGPVAVLTTGGFVAPPVALAAARLRIPVTLVNLDAVPGSASRLVARLRPTVFTVAPVPGEPTWQPIPPIVRRAFLDAADADPADARRCFGLNPTVRTLLVTGGSQGAGSVNALMLHLLDHHPAWWQGWQVIHQTGEGAADAVRSAYERAGVPASVHDFMHDMPSAWRSADLAISRAGAGAVAEAWAMRVPTLFLPYPWHRDQHQRLNAQPLVDAGAAALVTDAIDPARTLTESRTQIEALFTNPDILRRLREQAAALPPATGASHVGDQLPDRFG